MPTNAILFGNGGSGQVNNPTAVNFASPFQSAVISGVVADTNYWSSIRCNPVEIKRALFSPTVYDYDSASGNELRLQAPSGTVVNKIFSIILWTTLQSTRVSTNNIAMWMFAPDDDYLPTGSYGFNQLKLRDNNGVHYTSITTDTNTYQLKYPWSTNSKNVIQIYWTGKHKAPFGNYNAGSSGVYADVRYI